MVIFAPCWVHPYVAGRKPLISSNGLELPVTLASPSFECDMIQPVVISDWLFS